MKISHSIDINKQPAEVFPWLGDPEKARIWMTSVSKTEYLNKTPDMVGTTFRETVEEDGRGTDLLGVITAYQENRLIAFHLDGQFNVVDVEYRLEEIENHTRLTTKATVRFKAFLKVISVFFGAAFKKKIMEQSQKEFTRLKELCESDAST